MPRLLVNCHGGRVGDATFAVPQGVTIHFYCQDGALLLDEDGWTVLNHRLQSQPGQLAQLAEQIGEGHQCYNYIGVPYSRLGIVNGIQREETSRGRTFFNTLLQAGTSFEWGPPVAGTINVQRQTLPAVMGGESYPRSVVTLQDLAACPNVTDVDWISCRELWH